jgi:hypothetical protein
MGKIFQTVRSTCTPHYDITDQDIRWLYIPNINVDGNFELEHLAMKDPLSDVSLSNGEGFMVEDTQYKFHLDMTQDSKEVSRLQP